MCNKLHIITNISNGTILTPVACANLIAELIKNLIYQKSQIPYPFIYFKNAIIKKRRSEEATKDEKPLNLSVQNHFRSASKAYDNIVNILWNIENELKSTENAIEEIVILFGMTYHLAREVYRIVIPRLEYDHNEENHFNDTQKCVRNILRNILTSDEWNQFTENSIPLTNMYILLKKSSISENSCDIFVPIENFTPSHKISQLEIKVVYKSSAKSSCCSKVIIFGQEKTVCANFDNKNNDIYSWYLANICFKGFKDVFINKVSASELW